MTAGVLSGRYLLGRRMLLESGACDKHLSLRQYWLVEMGHRRHLLRRVVGSRVSTSIPLVSRACDKTHHFGKPKRRDRTPRHWFKDRLDGGPEIASKGLGTRAFDNAVPFGKHPASKSDTAIPLRRPVGWPLGDRFQRIGNSCVRQSESPRQTSSVGILRSIVARTSCVCYDPLKDAAELRWWPLPPKPDRTKPCTGARESG